MEEKKTMDRGLVGAIAYAIMGIVSLCFIGPKFFLSHLMILTGASYLAIAYFMFKKRQDNILPICFSVLAVLNIFSLNIFGILTNAFMAYFCFGEFTNYIEKFYKKEVGKLYTAFVVLVVLAAILGSGILLGIVHAFAYANAFFWVTNFQGPKKKVYNVITADSVGVTSNAPETSEETTEDTGMQRPETSENKTIIDLIYDCYCENVRSGLKAPLTAVFCKPEELMIKECEGVYTVSGYVDSQNSYGAMIRTRMTIKMIKENGKFVSKTNIGLMGTKHFAANYITYTIFGIIMAAILTGISYLIVSSMY